MFIWRSILRLPENHAAYAALVDKGTHPAFDKLDKEYPIKSRRLLRILQRYVQKILIFCRPEAPKRVLWQTVKIQMKCRIMRHFIWVCTVFSEKIIARERNTILFENYSQ